MIDYRNWPLSIIDRVALSDDIGWFLRTHINGAEKLRDLMISIPPDFSEAELRQVRESGRRYFSSVE